MEAQTGPTQDLADAATAHTAALVAAAAAVVAAAAARLAASSDHWELVEVCLFFCTSLLDLMIPSFAA